MKRVDPSVYTKQYYLSDCSGHEYFKRTSGKELEPRLELIANRITEIRGKQIVDIGCGRGELVYWLAKNGAKKVFGVDYSKAAINISKSSRKSWPVNIRRY